MNHKRRIGLYLSAPVVLRNPNYVPVLQDKLGLNLVILGFSGEVTPEIKAFSPFDGFPLSDENLRDLVATHLDGQTVDTTEYDHVRASIGPSVRAQGDDTEFREAIRTLKACGVEVWICGGSWTERRLMFCPCEERTNQWYEALYCYWANQYGVDGVDITHARYPMGSMPRGLGACSCARCSRVADRMNYSMGRMQAGLLNVVEQVRRLDADLLRLALRHGLGLFDFLQMVGMDGAVIDWFRFRSEVMTRNLTRFRLAVREAAGPDILFGSDTYPASLSLYVGHNHTEWARFSDFASPLVSHIPAFVTNTLIEWARYVRSVNPALSETDALRLIYRLTGYDGVGLPETIADYHLEDASLFVRSVPVKDVVLQDVVKARLYLPPAIPSYPIIQGEGWPKETIDAIVEGIYQAGHDGVIFQGTGALVDYTIH